MILFYFEDVKFKSLKKYVDFKQKSKKSTSYESPNIEMIAAQRTRACGIIMRKHPYFSCSHTCLLYRVANDMKYSVWLATYQLYAIGDLFSSHHDHRRTNNPRAFCSKMAPYRSLNFIVCASTLLFITYLWFLSSFSNMACTINCGFHLS